MKKLLISLFLVLCWVAFVNAQGFKPSKGLTLEVNFRPANVAAPINVNGLKARFFFNDNMALRFALYMNMDNHKWSNQFNVGTTTPIIVEECKNKYFEIGFAPGFEYHIGHMERLSPYFGGVFGLVITSCNASVENAGGVLGDKCEVSGATLVPGAGLATYEDYGSTEIYITALAGMDFYIAKHLYLGVEVGLGFDYESQKDIETSATTSGVTASVKDPLGDKFTALGIVWNPCIRLGWAF